MKCPRCQSISIKKNGKTKSGKQAYRCNECDRRFSENPTGRPPIGNRPMTDAERKQRQRKKDNPD